MKNNQKEIDEYSIETKLPQEDLKALASLRASKKKTQNRILAKMKNNQNKIDCYSKNGEIINNNQKEIDMIAELFHNTYEKLAPKYNYKTRKATAVNWEDVPQNNKNLMKAVVREILSKLQKDEIVIARGKVEFIVMGGFITYKIGGQYIDDSLEPFINKNIILKVVKDE